MAETLHPPEDFFPHFESHCARSWELSTALLPQPLFLPACAPWVSLASPKCSLLLPTPCGWDLLPCRRAAGWHLQAARCFTSLYFWLLLTSYFLQ